MTLMTRTNSRMRALGFPPASTDADQSLLAPSLATVLAAGFDEVSDCVILAHFEATARRTSIESCHDETGFEEFVNHVHIADALAPGPSETDVVAQAALFVQCLAANLANAYPDRTFEVVVSLRDDKCRVGFHAVRSGQTWLADDIEGYGDEAVMSIRVARQQ
jgi:hypothetical protein